MADMLKGWAQCLGFVVVCYAIMVVGALAFALPIIYVVKGF